MAVIMNGASDFDGFGPVSASVLHPWLAFGEQVTLDSELHALTNAIDALTWEWEASWHSGQASVWVGAGSVESIIQALHFLQEVGKNMRRASTAWGNATFWLKEHGDPGKVALYTPFYRHVLAQQQRLDQQFEQLRARIVLLCQEWGIALEAVPDLSMEAGNGH